MADANGAGRMDPWQLTRNDPVGGDPDASSTAAAGSAWKSPSVALKQGKREPSHEEVAVAG